jgi:hypothetical protein
MFVKAIHLIVILLVTQSQSQRDVVPEDLAERTRTSDTWQEAVAFTERVKELGPWQEQSRQINQMVETVFTQNGWDSEADLFARDLAVQVSALPPWDINGRIDMLTNAVAVRYQLSGEQRSDLRQRIWGDVITLTKRSFPSMLPTLGEMLETRAAGEPFTPEQVSRWMRNMRPLIDRNMEYIQSSLSAFRQTLEPHQREIFDRDVAAADRRAMVVMNQMTHWERGQWKPADWGLQHDPIHAKQAEPNPRPQPAPRERRLRRELAGPVAAEASVVARDRDQWEQYVEQFIRRYGLDEAQQTAAWSVYADLKARADQWHASHADELNALEAKANASEGDASQRQSAKQHLSEAKQPLVDMFAELKSRLDNLLTSEQRSKEEEPQRRPDRRRSSGAS